MLIILSSIFAKRVPLCPQCHPSGNVAELQEPIRRTAKRLKLAEKWTDGASENDGSDDDDYGILPSPWKGKSVLKPSITFFGA
jgi:hypothetical protein